MIKSKIDARERALELAVAFGKDNGRVYIKHIVDCASEFEKYLVGEAELPEKELSVEELTAKSLERILTASNQQNLGAMGIIGSFDKNNKS